MAIKLEDGKVYLDRSGLIRGPMEASGFLAFAFSCDDKTWKDDGSFHIEGESETDLVAEYVPPQVPGIPKGYRLVRVGIPEQNEWFVNPFGLPQQWMSASGYMTFAIIEPIVMPVPETRKAPVMMTVEEFIEKLSEHNPKAAVTFSVAIDTSIDEGQRWFCEDEPIAIQGNGHPELNPDNETVVTICIVAKSNM